MMLLKSRQIVVALGWASAFWILTGPSGSSVLPPGIYWFDLLSVVLLFIFLSCFIVRPTFRKTQAKLMIVGFSLYLVLVLTIPLIGIGFFAMPMEWYWGDLRWVQVVLIGIALWWGYSSETIKQPERHFRFFLALLVCWQLPFVVAQVSYEYLRLPPASFLELYYPEGISGYGVYGAWGGRYSGAMHLPSALGMVGGVGLLFFGIRILRAGYWSDWLLVAVSLAVVMASGTRTTIFGAGGALLLIWIGYIYCRSALKMRLLWQFIVALPAALLFIAIMFEFNIGRIATSDRYYEIFGWIIGEYSFEFVAGGRGGAMWSEPLSVAFTDYSPLGTLVNASHSVGFIDSYFLFLLAQAGPFILVPFICLVFILLVSGATAIMQDRPPPTLPEVVLSVAIVLAFSSFTQNTLTGMPGRMLLVLAVLSCALLYRRHLNNQGAHQRFSGGVVGDRAIDLEGR